MTKICSLKTTLEKQYYISKEFWKCGDRGILTQEDKIIIFKTLALSKITFLAQVLVIPNQIIDGLQQM